jgi:plasmid maintenance system antidote protein VapI
MRKENTIDTILLRELKKTRQTPYEIAKQTGVAQSALSRFISGERGLSVWAAAQLLKHFGYKIVKE